ncbi:hypothetical protein BCR35DRAFT_307668 [Leucosporidium creatinivorum]|uniref:Uncharacterized protein n=1 Tax=Leucosporidium creatinivorum TaxID=106004 RepID=A0A1Y2ELH2_9BASI|nr:hypothetical protein BCR35DRAFT_307668 [Leucosporidium creatinivorum]
MLFSAALSLLTASVALAAPSAPSLSSRATVLLADGSKMASGQITPTLLWQSSGQFSTGACPGSVRISQCYTMGLSASPTGNLATRSFGHHYHFDNTTDPLEFTPILEQEEEDSDLSSRGVSHALLPRAVATNTTTNSTIPITNTTVLIVPSPRQRIEMLSWPPAPAGTSWKYGWRSMLNRGAGSGKTFFHLMQLLRRDASGGAVITLDAKLGNVGIYDAVRGCSNCVSLPMASIIGRTLEHNVTVTYGLNGTFTYQMRDVVLNTTLLSYTAVGDMGAQGSIKYGAYRATYAGMSSITNFVGDHSAVAYRP